MSPTLLNLKIYHGITFGPLLITCYDSDGAVVDLTGWAVYAQARFNYRTPAFDLLPTIFTDTDGIKKIKIELTDEQALVPPIGVFRWDLILEEPSGERYGPYIAGNVVVQAMNTVVAA